MFPGAPASRRQAREARNERARRDFREAGDSTGARRAGCDLFANASPPGMNVGDPAPFPDDAAGQGALATDVVLSERPARFLAAARGGAAQNGRAMLEAQIGPIADFFGARG